MKALVKTQKGDGFFEIQDIPKPEIKKEDDVLIRVLAAGVCGTDVHILHDEFPYWPPVVVGHEFVGVVEEIGSAVTNFKVGDRIVAEPHTHFCGKCDMCRSGRIQLCAHKRSPGWGMNGAFTDYLVMPELFLHHVPQKVSDEVAALAEPLAIVTHEVLERAKVEPQDKIAIVGAGPIALLAAVAARSGGASRIYMLGTDADEALRFPTAKKLGIDAVINVQHENVEEKILELTDGKGVDMVIEASGAEAGINTAISIVKKCGRICVIGVPSREKVNIKWKMMVNKVLDVIFNFSSSVSSWERALSIMDTTPYDLSAIITHRVNITEWESAFEDIAAGKAIKVLFLPEKK